MKFQSKHDVDDIVWTLNPKTAVADRRKIVGVRSQSFLGYSNIYYAFLKDLSKDVSKPTTDDVFWVL